MKNDNTLLIGLGCIAAYFFFIKPKMASGPVVVVPGSSQGLPAYIPPVSVPGLPVVTPNPPNQLPVTIAPGSSMSYNPGALPVSLLPVSPASLPPDPVQMPPVFTDNTPLPAPGVTPVYGAPVLSVAPDNTSQYTVTYSNAAGQTTAADYFAAQSSPNLPTGVLIAPNDTGVIINTNDALYKMFQNGGYPGANKSQGYMSGIFRESIGLV